MPSSHIYNLSLTPEALDAFRRRDVNQLRDMVIDQAANLGQVEEKDYHAAAAQLMLTISLYDSLKGGHASMLVSDFINF